MPYAFDYAVASSYGASFAAREEENGRGTVGQFQMVGQNIFHHLLSITHVFFFCPSI